MSALVLMLYFTGFGFICFGGGYMLIAIMMHFFVEAHPMLSAEQFGNLISISQLTPGPTGINAATFLGYQLGGFWCSLFSTLGLVVPSLTIGFAAVTYFRKYRNDPRVAGVITSIKAAAAGSIIYAALVLAGVSVFSRQIPWREIFSGSLPDDFKVSLAGVIIACIAIVLKKKTALPVGAIILIGALCGAAAFGAKLW